MFTKDVNLLLNDPTFMKKNEGKVGFIHADIPFGYFNSVADIPWDEATVRRVAAATYSLCTPTGTLLIKMGDRDQELWRAALQQAGWHVERDRKVLLQRPALMRKKSFISHAPEVNAVHYWLAAHKGTGYNYYQHPKPFGKGGGEAGGRGRGRGIISYIPFPFPSFTIIHHRYTPNSHRNYKYRSVPQQLQRVPRRASGPNQWQTARQTGQNRADPGDQHA